MDWREKLFGKKLIRCDSPGSSTVQFSTIPTVEALSDCVLEGDGTVLGIYFSFANISEESDDFPLKLEEVYRIVHPRLKIVQVVLWAHGGTKDGPAEREIGFRNSIIGKPWFAVSFHDVEVKRNLTKRYNIGVGVPALVIRDRHVRDTLLADTRAELFPWPPPKLKNVLESIPLQRCDKSKTNIQYKDIPNDVIRMFYFAAHWCPPCRTFTPSVCNALAHIRKRKNTSPQLILISSDRSEESYNRTVSSVSTEGAVAVPWCEAAVRMQLASALDVAGIPALVLIDANDKILTHRGRQALSADPEALNFPWEPRLVTVLTEHSLIKMSQRPAIILFVEDAESEIAFAESVLTPAAESYHEDLTIQHPNHSPYQSSSDEDAIDYSYSLNKRIRYKRTLFFIGIDGTECVEMLRDHISLDDAVPLLTAIDFTKRRLATMTYGEQITTHSVQNFLDSYLSEQCKFIPIKAFSEKFPD